MALAVFAQLLAISAHVIMIMLIVTLVAMAYGRSVETNYRICRHVHPNPSY